MIFKAFRIRILVLCLFLTGVSFSATNFTATSGIWDDPCNWDNGLPGTNNRAVIDQGTCTLQTKDALAKYCDLVRENSTDANLIVNGALVVLEDYRQHFDSASGNGYMEHNGDVSVGDEVILVDNSGNTGSATLVHNSGTFEVAGDFITNDAQSAVDVNVVLNGGKIDVGNIFNFGRVVTESIATMTINPGVTLNTGFDLRIGWGGDTTLPATVTVNGGILNIGGEIQLGRSTGQGILIVNDGRITAGLGGGRDDLRLGGPNKDVGIGICTINGGRVEIFDDVFIGDGGATGTLNINAGVLDVNDNINLSPDAAGIANVNIVDGTNTTARYRLKKEVAYIR